MVKYCHISKDYLNITSLGIIQSNLYFYIIKWKKIMKRTTTFILSMAFFTITKFVFSCENIDKGVENEISIWLGDKSQFSKAYVDGKCALDKVLKNFPVNQRKIIASLIAKSYQYEESKNKEVKTYNY